MDLDFLNNLDLNTRLISFVAIIIVTIIAFFIMRSEYIRVLSKKNKKNTDCKITNILSAETYKKTKKFFDSYLEAPVIIIIIVILFVIPLFVPFYISFEIIFLSFLTIMVLYLALFPQIFQVIEKKNIVKLDQYLIGQKEDSAAVIEMFNYIWEITDDDIVTRFSISPVVIFTVFSQKIDNLFLNNKTTILLIYFDNFLDFIDKRSAVFLTHPKFFSKILEWHLMVWKRKNKYHQIGNNELNSSDYDEILMILESIFQKIQKHPLEEKELSLFLKILTDHIKKEREVFFEHKDNNVKYYYVKPLFALFWEEFLVTIENLPDKDQEKIWKNYFLKEWKITKDNLEDKKNIMTNISLNIFLNWAQGKIWEDKKEDLDKKVDVISKNLFPEVESVMWDRILIFVLTPRCSKNKVEAVIERSCNFGFEKEKNLDYLKKEDNKEFFKEKRKRVEKTFELALFLFPHQFSKENLDGYIKSLKKIKYEEMTGERNKRVQLLNIFEKLLKYKIQQSKYS